MRIDSETKTFTCWILVVAFVLLSINSKAYKAAEEKRLREEDMVAFAENKPTAYLDGRRVNLELLNLEQYVWEYDAEANIVKLSKRIDFER